MNHLLNIHNRLNIADIVCKCQKSKSVYFINLRIKAQISDCQRVACIKQIGMCKQLIFPQNIIKRTLFKLLRRGIKTFIVNFRIIKQSLSRVICFSLEFILSRIMQIYKNNFLLKNLWTSSWIALLLCLLF